MNDMNMEQLVSELQKMMPFKKEIDTGDIVLIAADDPRLLAYAVVTGIEADPSRKDPWWHVHMEMLAVPLQPMTWTLRMEQMCGQEIFTMGGKKRFMAPVAIGYEKHHETVPPGRDERSGKDGAKRTKKGGLRIIK
jgi:hypothetical protein